MSQRATWIALGVILLVALGLRLARWSEERAGILAQVPTGDERTYDQWAQRIAAGTQPDAVPYLAPLPAYALAGWHAALAPAAARDAQRLVGVALGVLTCALAFVLGRALGGAGPGLVAAALTALHAPLIYYEPTLLRDGPAATLLGLAAWLTLGAQRRLESGAAAPWALGAGLTLGAGALWRENLLLVGVALTLVVAARAWRRPAARRPALALALGLSLPLTPVWLHNSRLEGAATSPLPTWNGGCVFYMANQRANRGLGYLHPPFVPFANPEAQMRGFHAEAERRAGRRLTPHQVSSYWLRQGLADVAAEPGLYASKLTQRAVIAAASQELVQARDLRLDRQSSWVLALPLPGFGLIAAFALLGLGLRRRDAPARALGFLVLVALGTTLLVGFVSRYRLPLLPLLAALAAVGLAGASRRARAGRWGALALGLALTMVCTSIPVPYDPNAGRWSRALAYLEAGRPDPAFVELELLEPAPRADYGRRLVQLLLQNGEERLAREAAARLLGPR